MASLFACLGSTTNPVPLLQSLALRAPSDNDGSSSLAREHMYNSVETRYGRFELIMELGQGLKSAVYLARDPEIERCVALKVLREPTLSTDAISDRIKAVSQLSHLRIAKVFDFCFTEPERVPYLVLEYIEGNSLEVLLTTKGKLPQQEAIALTIELLDALSHAHSHRVNHHNLKPSNLLITPDRHLKVTDFVHLKSSSTAFMAPERLNSEGDARSDLFSVGVILYLMLSGHRPFQGNTDATISFKLVHQHPVPVAAMDLKLAPELDFVIARLMAKNPEERYQSADEARCDLEAIQRGFAPQDPAVSQNLIEQIGFVGKNESLPATQRRAVKPTAAPRTPSWRLWVPVVAALLLLATVVGLRPYLQPLPPAPIAGARHLSVPAFAMRKSATPVRSRSTVVKPASPVAASASATVASAKGAANSKPEARLVPVPLEIRQPFKKFTMSIWVDDRLTFSNEIQPEKKKRFLGMGSASAGYLTLLQMPVGEHQLRFEVKATGENFDGTTQLSAKFSELSGQKLLVRCDKTRNQLQVEVN